jgi:hypothetical protein
MISFVVNHSFEEREWANSPISSPLADQKRPTGLQPVDLLKPGEGGQTRTADHLLKRQMLYRLSYTPICLNPKFIRTESYEL